MRQCYFGRTVNITSARCLVIVAAVSVLHFITTDRHRHVSQTLAHGLRSLAAIDNAIARISGSRPGVIVLGMHRSGTSMLSGILAEGFGYETGGPLLKPNNQNEKGYYERSDVVVQNHELFRAQGIGWDRNVINYDSEKGLRDITLGKIKFNGGKRALAFLNNDNQARALPYLQKDPRMCITLPTWLKLLDDEPAVLFTYRHPLEVALSLKKRDPRGSSTIEYGLQLWIHYNYRAIQNSAGMCRVVTSNHKIMKNPKWEVQRIKNELTNRCNVMPPPISVVPKMVIDSFIDPNLQHNGKVLKDISAHCTATAFESDHEVGSPEFKAERKLFLIAMQMFCDMESGKAFEEGYLWAELLKQLQ